MGWLFRVCLSACVIYPLAAAVLTAAHVFFGFDISAAARSVIDGIPWVAGVPASVSAALTSPFIAIGLALAPVAIAVAEHPMLRGVARRIAPEQPSFLDWVVNPTEEDSPWSKSPKLRGRTQELQRLLAFANQNEKRESWYAVSGVPGVGKTRVAIEWMRTLRNAGWQTGILLPGRPPEGWVAARKLAVVIDEAGRRPQLWADLDTLLRMKAENIRVLLVDTDELRPDGGEQEMRKVRESWYVPDAAPARGSTHQTRAPSRRGAYDQRAGQRQSNSNAEVGAGLHISQLEDAELRKILQDFRPTSLNEPTLNDAIRRSGGRVRYAINLVRGDGNYLKLLRDKATKFVEAADKIFDAEIGREVLIASALIGQVSISDLPEKARRHGKLARLFAVAEGSLRRDKEIPRIVPEEQGVAVVLKALEDLPSADQSRMLERVLGVGAGGNAGINFGISVGNMLPLLTEKQETPDDLISIGTALRALERAVAENAGVRAMRSESGERDATEDALCACLKVALLRGVLPRRVMAKLGARIFSMAPEALDALAPGDRHAALIGAMRSAVVPLMLEEDFDLFAESDVWAAHPVQTASALLVFLNGSEAYWEDDVPSVEELGTALPLSAAWEQLPDDSPLRPAFFAFHTMERAFQGDLTQAEAADAEPKIAELLRSSDKLDIAIGTLACQWLVRGPAMSDPIIRLSADTCNALCKIICDAPNPSTWRRAALALARNAREIGDTMYEWAVHTDESPTTAMTTMFTFVSPAIDATSALDAARSRLRSNKTDVHERARAALLLTAFDQREPEALSAMEEFLSAEPLRSTNYAPLCDITITYMVASFGAAASAALEKFVREGAPHLRDRAFLALSSLGQLRRIRDFDFEKEWGSDGQLYANTMKTVLSSQTL